MERKPITFERLVLAAAGTLGIMYVSNSCQSCIEHSYATQIFLTKQCNEVYGAALKRGKISGMVFDAGLRYDVTANKQGDLEIIANVNGQDYKFIDKKHDTDLETIKIGNEPQREPNMFSNEVPTYWSVLTQIAKDLKSKKDEV